MTADEQRDELLALLEGDEDDLREVLSLIRAEEEGRAEFPNLHGSEIPDCTVRWTELADIAAKPTVFERMRERVATVPSGILHGAIVLLLLGLPLAGILVHTWVVGEVRAASTLADKALPFAVWIAIFGTFALILMFALQLVARPSYSDRPQNKPKSKGGLSTLITAIASWGPVCALAAVAVLALFGISRKPAAAPPVAKDPEAAPVGPGTSEPTLRVAASELRQLQDLLREQRRHLAMAIRSEYSASPMEMRMARMDWPMGNPQGDLTRMLLHNVTNDTDSAIAAFEALEKRAVLQANSSDPAEVERALDFLGHLRACRTALEDLQEPSVETPDPAPAIQNE